MGWQGGQPNNSAERQISHSNPTKRKRNGHKRPRTHIHSPANRAIFKKRSTTLAASKAEKLKKIKAIQPLDKSNHKINKITCQANTRNRDVQNYCLQKNTPNHPLWENHYLGGRQPNSHPFYNSSSSNLPGLDTKSRQLRKSTLQELQEENANRDMQMLQQQSYQAIQRNPDHFNVRKDA